MGTTDERTSIPRCGSARNVALTCPPRRIVARGMFLPILAKYISPPRSVEQATEDDMIPLSHPVVTPFTPTPITHFSIPRGTVVTVPIASINRSKALWGPDAKQFKPARWTREDGIPRQAKEIQGHKHLLTFADGPRTCLGKGFAVAEVKVCMCTPVASCPCSDLTCRWPYRTGTRSSFLSSYGTLRSSSAMDIKRSWVSLAGFYHVRR